MLVPDLQAITRSVSENTMVYLPYKNFIWVDLRYNMNSGMREIGVSDNLALRICKGRTLNESSIQLFVKKSPWLHPYYLCKYYTDVVEIVRQADWLYHRRQCSLLMFSYELLFYLISQSISIYFFPRSFSSHHVAFYSQCSWLVSCCQ